MLFDNVIKSMQLNIWMARNKKIHNNVSPNLLSVVAQIQRSISYHLKAWSDVDLVDSWSCPPFGALKVEL
jgi:hypothetical protein